MPQAMHIHTTLKPPRTPVEEPDSALLAHFALWQACQARIDALPARTDAGLRAKARILKQTIWLDYPTEEERAEHNPDIRWAWALAEDIIGRVGA